jgi:nondiscriminating glutamyl-tRNA synthetase
MTPCFRFAPSPTGGLHIGTARTALFNWLAASSMEGKVILRIEDTDVKRSSRVYEKSIIRDLRWLGLSWDEFYRQSERINIYQNFAARLLEENKAYRCFCTPERLKKLRESQYAAGKMSKYDNRCRELDDAEIKKNLREGRKFAIRFKVEDNRDIIFNDLIRGEIRFKSSVIGDFVIMKSDGTPSYNFAVVVDDGDMGVTHVLRGEDHLTNTARQILLFESLGFKVPSFAHISMILAKDGSKLSKRFGATTISQFRQEGYLAEAIVNYLSILSWSPDDNQEIFDTRDIKDKFNIADISKSPAIFDIDKLNWLNGIYIRKKSIKELVELGLPYLVKEKVLDKKDIKNKKIMDKIYKCAGAFQDNLRVMSDFTRYVRDFLTDEFSGYSPEALEILRLNTSGLVIQEFLGELEKSWKSFDNNKDIDLNEEQSKRIINNAGEKLKKMKIKGKFLYMPIRVSVTGKTAGPGLPAIISILGLKNCIQRVKQTLEYMEINI